MSDAIDSRSLDDLLREMRREHPPRTLDRDGVTWRYTAVGEGPSGLLLLPGAVGSGEAYLPLVPTLAEHFRMVMIRYPPADGLDALVDGLAAILDREGIAGVAIVGGSFGGLVAQAFVHRFPARTSKVVLSATAPPDPGRAASNARWSRIVDFLPMALVRGLLRLVLRKLLKPVRTEKVFWRRFYAEAVGELSRADLRARYRVSIDFDRRGGPDPEALAGCEILILEGAEDRMTRAAVRDAMRTGYPRAVFHTFDGAGHGIALERPEEWSRTVRDFLLDGAGADCRTPEEKDRTD